MKKKSNLGILIWPLVSLLFFAALLFVERSGVQYDLSISGMDFVPQKVMDAAKPELKKECLVLYDSLSEAGFYENIGFVLDSMSVGYQLYDVGGEEAIPSWDQYETVVIALTNLDHMQSCIVSLFDWVEGGGRLLLAEIPEPNATLWGVYKKLGISNERFDYRSQSGIRMITDLLPGGGDQEFFWDDGVRKELGVLLSDNCIVHMVSADDSQIPMLWEHPLGDGKVVVNNNDLLDEKLSRGLFAAEYSLLYDVFAYPIINASVFFIDDFPAPIPGGYNEIIYEQYQSDTEDFYINQWFPDILNLAHKYGLKYTAMLIETYGDSVDPPFEPIDTGEYFSYFGRLLLENDCEIGLHGYNHMSLVLENFDYKGLLGYTKWESTEDMAAATAEAIRFTNELFPDIQIKTYVAPSNVLSTEGRAMFKDNFPEINTFAGVYTDYDYGLEQEFGVGEDGIINLPRIVSGYSLDDAQRWAMLSETGFHYVNSYFIHPDDVLDAERSNGKTWEQLKDAFEEYLKWLSDSASGLRNLTAQDAAKAVQRYSNLSVGRSVEDGKLILDISGLYDEAWFLVRFNDSEPGFVQGGAIEYVTEDLCLLHATNNYVVITLER